MGIAFEQGLFISRTSGIHRRLRVRHPEVREGEGVYSYTESTG